MVTHILKDGTKLTDLKGHIIRREDAEMVYQMVERLRNEKKKAAQLNNQNNNSGCIDSCPDRNLLH